MSEASNKAVSLLRALYKGAHDVLEATMADVSAEMAHWQPQGEAHPIGGNYAHVVLGEDSILNGMARGAAPLMATAWAGKVGLSEMPPRGQPWQAWSQQVQIDLTALRAYAQAVYASTDEYLASLADSDLDRAVDLSALGFGQETLGWLLGIMLANVQWHTGEIACVKGLQGKKGYPF
jgi:hypothetical protein